MTSWEEGIFCIESEYYIFTENTPYSPPFTFKAILESGEEVEAQNVINSMESGDTGSLSVPSADSEMESQNEFESEWTEGRCWWIWIVITLVLFTVSIVYVLWRSRPTVSVSVKDEPSTPSFSETTTSSEGTEGIETNENTVEVVIPPRISHPAQLNPFDPQNRQYFEWK